MTMKANNLILILTLTLSLTLGAGASVAAIKHGHIEPATVAPAVDATRSAIPRVVVTASKAQVAEARIARIVVVGRRVDSSQIVAAGN
jgi:hypothetical protein